MCGASTLSHGVGGAAHSGVEVAAKVLDTTSEKLLENRDDQHLRIYDAEDESTWPAWIFQKNEDRKRRFRETVLPGDEKMNRHHHLSNPA